MILARSQAPELHNTAAAASAAKRVGPRNACRRHRWLPEGGRLVWRSTVEGHYPPSGRTQRGGFAALSLDMALVLIVRAWVLSLRRGQSPRVVQLCKLQTVLVMPITPILIPRFPPEFWLPKACTAVEGDRWKDWLVVFLDGQKWGRVMVAPLPRYYVLFCSGIACIVF